MTLISVLEESTNYHFLYESNVVPIPGDIIYEHDTKSELLVIKRRITTGSVMKNSITVYVTRII
jgi:hypothetical protein